MFTKGFFNQESLQSGVAKISLTTKRWCVFLCSIYFSIIHDPQETFGTLWHVDYFAEEGCGNKRTTL